MLPFGIQGRNEKYCSRTCVDIAFAAIQKGQKGKKQTVQTPAADYGNAGVTRARCDLKSCRKPITIKWADRASGKEYCSNKCLKQAKDNEMSGATATATEEDLNTIEEITETETPETDIVETVEDPEFEPTDAASEPVSTPAPVPAGKTKGKKTAKAKPVPTAPATAKKAAKPVKNAKAAAKKSTAKPAPAKKAAKTAKAAVAAKPKKTAAKAAVAAKTAKTAKTEKAAKVKKAPKTPKAPKVAKVGFDVFREGSAKHTIAMAFKTGKYMTREALEELAEKAGVGFGQVRFAIAQLETRGGIEFESRESDGAFRAKLPVKAA